VGITPPYSGGPGLKSRLQNRLSWLRFLVVFRSPSRQFSEYLTLNKVTIVFHFVVIVLFDTVWSEILTTSLNKPYILNIIRNVRHVLLYECAVHAMRKKLKLSFFGGYSGSKKSRRDHGGVWWSLLLAGVWNLGSGGRVYVSMFLLGTWLRSSWRRCHI
jgi:hypothetical protein